MIDKTISHYKILEKLGEGGMGVVYKAQDTRLKRTVALKFLPPDLTRDTDAKQRFMHEAQAASALDHNNICNIHEIDETEDGRTYIVMACYEGKILADIIRKGQIRIDETIHIAVQIAQGLEKAHKKGIIHRDIKPTNIFVTDDGIVKILDFGLAKLSRQTKLTKKGTTLGTVAYMSPEQTRGEDVDRRTDIWSLGVVLYEMLTGQLPFKGEYEQAVIYSIMNEEPVPVTDIRTGVPADLERIVQKTLIKSLDKRYRHMAEISADLMSLEKVPVSLPGKNKFTKMRHKLLLGITAVVLLFALIIVGYLLIRRDGREFRINRTLPLTAAPGLEQDPSWSPEGTRIAYASDESGNMDIWIRQISAGQKVNLTEDYTGYDGKPAWSPDGEWIVFVSDRDGGGIFVVPSLGGIPRRVVSLSFAPSLSYIGAIPPVCWSPDGAELAYATAGSIYIVSASSGTSTPVPLPSTGLLGYSEPAWSPDGKRIACTDFVAAGVATSRIWSVVRDGTDPVSITEGKHFDHNPVWSPDGRQLFFISDRGGSLDVWWLPVDARGKSTGPVQPLTTGAGVGSIALSMDGMRLIYTKIMERSNIYSIPIDPDRTLTLEDAQAHTSENHYIDLISVSPDGKRIAFDSNRSGNQDIWIMRTDGSELQQLTSHPAHDWVGSWSPDGNQIAFHSLRDGNRNLHVKPLAGGSVIRLTSHPGVDIIPVWSPDGEKIAFASNRCGNMDVWIMSSEGGEPRQLTFHGAHALTCWSPDGRRLSFGSKQTGKCELFLISAEGGDPVQLTHGMWLEITPQFWSSDGLTIFARGTGGPGIEGVNLWAISVSDGTARSLMNLKGTLKEPTLLSCDGNRIFFPLWECLGDLWMAELSVK